MHVFKYAFMLCVKILSKYYTTFRIRCQLPALQQTYLRIFHEFIIPSTFSQQNGQMQTITQHSNATNILQ